MLSKASKRCHIDGFGRGERILHLHTRCAEDYEACGLQYFEKSRGKVRAKRLQMVHDSGGVPEALIDVADLPNCTACKNCSGSARLAWCSVQDEVRRASSRTLKSRNAGSGLHELILAGKQCCGVVSLP